MTYDYSWGWEGLVYIAWSVQCEPLDQTDLKNGVDETYEAVENQHSKEGLTCGARGSGGLQVGPAGVLLSLLVSISLWISAIKSDM